ncbi:MAG: hypothetical protein ACK54H_09955, partial [Phycisphaerales bacterium]
MKQLCALISACLSAVAFAQQTGVLPQAFSGLRDQDVLVIYDSRIADSRAVAEFYAGSAKVPGGLGGLAARYPALKTLDLASTGAAVAAPGNISYADFVAKIRNPIRTHLT